MRTLTGSQSCTSHRILLCTGDPAYNRHLPNAPTAALLRRHIARDLSLPFLLGDLTVKMSPCGEQHHPAWSQLLKEGVGCGGRRHEGKRGGGYCTGYPTEQL
eukprot:Sspe_Gene.102131::Locus_76928_Transcript_1_2_Confidence_0.667_Length_417::g.102131::m.102131